MQACERAIAAVHANIKSQSDESDWQEVLAVDAAWRATETAWLASRQLQNVANVSQQALDAVQAALMEEPGSQDLILKLKEALQSHLEAVLRLTQRYVHLDEALVVAADRISERIAHLLETGQREVRSLNIKSKVMPRVRNVCRNAA